MGDPSVTGRTGSRASRLARAAAWIVVGGALVVTAGLAAFLLAMRFDLRRNVVAVPDLAGLSKDAAIAVLADARLSMEVVDERHDLNVSSGRVIQQDPAAGTDVRPGRKIRVIVSLGNQVVRIPEVVGRSARSVDLELRREGLLPGDEARVASSRAPAGTILAQVPAPGSPAMPGARINRLVSDGPRTPRWVMPDLTARPLGVAERWIESAGFRRGAVRRVSDGSRPRGTVVGQLPLAGYPVRARDVVELTVSE